MQISEPAEYVLLGLLNTRAMHGYEMFQQIENGAPGQIVHLEMSQMYAYLKKLERLNYIEAQLELQGARPPRKIFHLTETGQSIFLNWLIQPVQKPRDIRILFLIKFYFMQRFMPDQIVKLIQDQVQACQHFLERLEAREYPTTYPDDAAFFEQVVLSSRLHQTRALLEWLLDLRTQFTGTDQVLSKSAGDDSTTQGDRHN